MRKLLLTLVVALLALVALVLVTAPPPPLPPAPPAELDGPWFALRLHKPRTALPLGGVLPDGWLDETPRVLAFGSDDPGARVLEAGGGRLHLGADDWELVLELDDGGRPGGACELVFPVELANRTWVLRGRPARPALGRLELAPTETGTLAGSFELEISDCVRADTGQPIEWPPGVLTVVGTVAGLSPSPARPR